MSITNFDDNKPALLEALKTGGILDATNKKIVVKGFDFKSADDKVFSPAATDYLFITSAGEISDDTAAGDIAKLKFGATTGSSTATAAYTFTEIELLGGSGNWSVDINDSVVAGYTGLAAAKDNLTVTAADDAFVVKTIGDGDAGILDTIDIKQETAKVKIDQVTPQGGTAGALTVGEGGLEVKHGTADVLFEKGAKLGGANGGLAISGAMDKLVFTTESSTGDLIEFIGEVKGGDVSLDGSKTGKANVINATISDGTLTNGMVSLAASTVDASGGTYTDDELTIGATSKLTGFTKSESAHFALATDTSNLKIVGGTINGDIFIDGSNGTAGDSIEITTLGGIVDHTLAAAGKLDLKLEAGADSITSYYKLENGTQAATIYSGDMNITRNGDGFDIVGISNSAEKKEWNLGVATATINATTGTTSGNDEVTLSGAQVKTTLKTGTGADTIKLATDVNNTSIDGGVGDDVFDISSRAKGVEATVTVENFGVGKTKDTASDSTVGFDKIFVGTSFNADNDASYDTATNTLTVRGVKFTVNDGSYVLIGKYDSATSTTVFDSYLAEDSKLTLAAENVDPSDTTSGSGYNAADATALENYNKKNGEGTTADPETANSTFSKSTSASVKFLEITDGSDWTTKSIDMTSNGTSFVQVDKGVTSAAGAIKMGKSNENNIVFIDNKADLSSVSFTDYKSTKDVIISSTALDGYASSTATAKAENIPDANKFISSADGSFGTDLMAKNGSLVASSMKGGLYGAKYRQADIINDEVKVIDNEVLVVAGASAAGSFDATNATTQIFAMTNNNDAIADSVKGSKYADVFVAGAGDTVDGGASDDNIYTNTNKVTVKLATGTTADKDNIYGWKTKTGSVKLADGKDFSNISVGTYDRTSDDKNFTVADGSGANTYATFHTVNDNGVSTLGKSVFTTFVNDDGKSKTAFIYDANVATGAAVDTIQGLTADSVATASLYVGSGNGKNQLDFTGSGKGNIFLGHSDGSDGEFGDTSQYVNVKNVKSDSIGSAWVFGGSTAAQLTAGGDADSIWGGGKNSDTLVSNDTYRTFFGTTNGGGVDVIQKFKTGADAFGETTDTDVIYFVDGVDMSTMKVSNNQFIVGSNSSSGLAIDLGTIAGDDTTGGALITYALGLNGAKNVAKVDVTTDATTDGEITFTEDAHLYIGRGDKSTVTFGANNGNPVRFGFDSQYSGYNVRNLNGSEAVAGSIINGSTDRAQKVYASEKGASSIAGGFGDGFKDANSDTLIGGGENNFGTTFFVGKDMGSDNIQNLSDGDTVVFLNTKVSDITNNINSDTYGKNVSVVFNSGNRITATSTNNIADLEGVTVQFTDGTFTYDGVSKSWVRANA